MKHPAPIAGFIILGFLLMTVSVMAVSEPSVISPPLKQSDSTKSYEDESFQERAAYAIYNLTNPMPKDNDLMELKSLYYEIIRKNISPGFYSQAKDTVKYLFYAMKAAEGYQEYSEQTGSGHIDMDFKYDIYDQASLDLSAAGRIWPNISAFYPNASVIMHN